MSPFILLCLIIGVVLSAGAQIVLKIAMTQPEIRILLAASASTTRTSIFLEILSTPMIYAGLMLYAMSMVIWLFVLSRVDVSYAYPFVALGIVLTTLAGHFLLAEHVGPMRVFGCLVIATGIVIVARS